MRILIINWARIWQGAALGGGVNVYAQSLAYELARRGHDVAWLCSGRAYRGGLLPWRPGPCEIRRLDDDHGVRTFEVLNSPIIAPSIRQFSDPLAEISCPVLEDRFQEFISFLRPDVVHFQNIEGFSIGCVHAASRFGARVVFSLHNYHTVCPQVYLFKQETHVCENSRGGHDCAACVRTRPAAVERTLAILKNRLAHGTARGELGKAPPTDCIRGAPAELRILTRFFTPTTRPGLPFDTTEDVQDRAHAPTARAGRDQAARSDAPVRTPISNVALPDPPVDVAPNHYGRRRAAMVRMLSSCDAVLAVSDFVRDKFIALGVDERRIRMMPIGTRIGEHVERIRPQVQLPPPLTAQPTRPIRLCFMGYYNTYKGLDLLIEALELLSLQQLARLDLSIHALDGKRIRSRCEALGAGLARLTFEDGYRYDDIPRIALTQDLGIVPSVWWDNAPQTVFEFLACGVPVLGADLGGIPTFIRHGENGLLFRGNDREALAGTLRSIIDDPPLLTRLKHGVRPPVSIQMHVDQIISVYGECPQRGG